MRKHLLALMICAGLALPVFTASNQASKGTAPETIGGFAAKLATALGAPASSPKAAADTLRAAGVDLRADLGATLTHNEAARILAGLGMNVAAPSNPAEEVTVGKAAQLAASAGLSLSAVVGMTADLPVQCLLEKNHGKCTNCCKDALSDHPEILKVSRVCSRFCRNQPQTSDPEPLP